MKQRAVICTPVFFPQVNVESIPKVEACQAVNDCMQIWGCPQRIKIDNGLPFANAGNRDIPTLTQLWWIGLGIEVILNPPRTPQENGTVEGLQGICKRWSCSPKYGTMEEYQVRIDETNRIQREVYRIRKKGDKTRREIYPELWTGPNKYNPRDFDIQKVFDELSNRTWVRRTTNSGSLNFWSKSVYLGKPFIYHDVTITFDPFDCLWTIRATDGRILKEVENSIFTEGQILKNAGISKNSC